MDVCPKPPKPRSTGGATDVEDNYFHPTMVVRQSENVPLGGGTCCQTWVAGEGDAEMMPTEETMQRITYEDLRTVASYAVSQYIRDNTANVGHEVFRVPNNIIGRAIRWLLSRYLNKKVYKFRAKGRTPKIKGMRRFYRYGLPLGESKTIAIYIDTKKRFE